MTVAIVSYGVNNIGSVRRALVDLGADVVLAEHHDALAGADRVVLPGVGAFGEAMARLRAGGWVDALRRLVPQGRPLLGICLGMQMLADSSDENGTHDGLGLIAGRVRRLDALGCSLRIPHVGWNDVEYHGASPLFAKIPQGTDFYFVHSYAFEVGLPDTVRATTAYDVPLVASVQREHVFGTQFHPEKSSRAGRQVLKNFLDYGRC